jgi:hypothetical protein
LKKEEGRRKKEEGRGKMEDGRWKMEEGFMLFGVNTLYLCYNI